MTYALPALLDQHFLEEHVLDHHRLDRRVDAEQQLLAQAIQAGRAAQIVDAQLAQIDREAVRSEEHTSELQSLMRISYAVFCLKKKKHNTHPEHNSQSQNKCTHKR